MRVLAKFPGPYGRLLGVKELSLELSEGITLLELYQGLADRLKPLDPDATHTVVLVNYRQVPRETVLADGDVVYFLYVMGGG